MAYGYDGNLNALDWLGEIGDSAISSLRPEDREQLIASGVITREGTVNKEQLALAQQWQARGHIACDVVTETATEPLADPALIFAGTESHDGSFGMSPLHPHKRGHTH